VRLPLEPFRRHPWTWAVPLALVVVNVVWLSAFGSGARLRAADLDSRLARARETHAAETARLAERERLWIAATENRDRVESLYRERFSTERGRLTAVVREIRELAARAGLEPQTVSYPEESLEEYDLVRRSLVFTVEGGYADLRTFLHLLELTPTFVNVEQIRVAERPGGALAISLRLSTLFALDEGSREAGAAGVATGATPARPPAPATGAGS
jgi:Tfp pilus assembly protein PilO